MNSETKVTNIRSLIITVCLVVVIITAGTFAWLTYRSKSTALVLTIGDINDIQITLKPYQLDLELSPVLTYTSLDTNEEYVTISVVNNSSEDQNFNLYYDISHIDSSLISSDFKYTLLRTNDNNITSGNFSNANTNDNLYILKDFSIPANTTWNYRVYTWVDGTNNPNISNALFEANLQAKLLGVHIPLPDFITTGAVMDNVSSTYVTNSSGVQFNAISSDTNGKGLYIRSGTENDSYPIYYYRGAVDNNNLIFGGFCWKILRTTSTGGIKLVYNGTPSNGTCTTRTGTSTNINATTYKYNANYNSLTDVGYMSGIRYTYLQATPSGVRVYGKNITYENGTYTLVDTKTMNSNSNWSSYYSTLNSYHYTCLDNTASCSSVKYIYYMDQTHATYITLTDGEDIEDALNAMLYNSSDSTDSTIKATIDAWYQTNMLSYTSYLEDTPWCSDRTIVALAGWDPNGASDSLLFKPWNTVTVTLSPNLSCAKNDSFTVFDTMNGNGKLTYPVGSLTADEIMLAGGKYATANSSYYLYTNQNYWSISPSNYNITDGLVFYVSSTGALTIASSVGIGELRGIRPVISLKPGIVMSSGTGTTSNPYVVS